MIAAPDALDALHVEARGEGLPLVLAHGFAGSARNWGPQVRAFRERACVVTYDLRGHARSSAPHACPDAYTAEAFVADMARVIDSIEPVGAPAVVGGLSLGAGVALGYARRFPERVRGLVLASLPAGPGRAGAFSGSAQEMARVLESQGSEAAGARFVWGPESGLDPRGAALVRQGFVEHDPMGLSQTLRGALQELAAGVDAPDLEERLRMPILLVAGERDEASLEAMHRMAARLPHARGVVIPEAGHVVNLAAPAEFNAALADFLDALAE